MPSILLISIRFHEGRYHGTGDWPPSPARLFQALIAGAGLQGPLQVDQVKALEWLETMPPPVLAAPFISKGQSVGNFVPNNDLDAVGGDSRRIGSIRARKEIRPLLPESAKRRRIEPSRRSAEAKSASERTHEQHQARLAVLAALRHAGYNIDVLDIVVQREPFQSHGARAEAFAPGTRFAKERLWHVSLKFANKVQGPLVLGDGRFLGLGVFAPS